MFKTVTYGVDVATIRRVLAKPHNFRWANQREAFERMIQQRCAGSSDVQAVIDSMVANKELPENPDWVEVHQLLQRKNMDFDCTMEAVAKALDEHCLNAGLPITIHTLERAFEQIQASFIPHSQKWYDDQIRKQNQLEAERLRGELLQSYKQSFEYRLV